VTGTASWYGRDFHGDHTASGERFDQDEFTAAHPSLPLGTRVRVTNLANGRSVVVRINDRGPFTHGRVLDVSYRAAHALGMLRRGTARVRMEVLEGAAASPEEGRARVRRPPRRHRPRAPARPR
jgi:rare lipoprotein A